MRILIATHGTLAEGLKSALSIIVGKIEKVDTITAYVNDVDIEKELSSYFLKHKDEELIICTDLFGGSVNQKLIQKLKEKDFTLITGVNLPLLLELVIAVNSENADKDKINAIVQSSQKQTMIVNHLLFIDKDDDFD